MKKQIETRYANLAPVVVDPVLQRNGLKQLEQAIELIPNCQKEAYLEAKRRCPLLIEKEPGLMRFLEYDRFDVWAAARRLVAYWTMRKDLFQERAFLPMHQTGNGALSKTDLEVLATGFSSILPAKNVNGDSYVICYIPSRIDKDKDIVISRRRCTFYMMSVLMNLNDVSKNTFSGIAMFNQIGFQRTLMMKPTVEMIKQLPIYSDYGVIAHCPMDVERKTFFEMLAPTIMKLFERDGGHKSSGVIDAVSASSRQDLADQLVTCGFVRESLPPECGGPFSVTRFRQWQVERIALERQRELEYFGVARRISSTCASGAMGNHAEHRYSHGPPSPLATIDELDKRWEWENLASAELPLSSLDGLEQALERESSGEAKRPAFPSATMSAQDQNFENGNLDDRTTAKMPASPTTKSTMDAYNRRLAEALLEDEMLRGPSFEAERLERKRMLDREHSKRKRARRKDRFAALQESHADCVVENARLKKESEFLKKLLRESKKIIRCHVSGNDGSVSTTGRQSVAVEPSTPTQPQTRIIADESISIIDHVSSVSASSATKQHHMGQHDGSVSIDRQPVVAVSSAADQQHPIGHDGYASVLSLSDIFPIRSLMNLRPPDVATASRNNNNNGLHPFTTAVGAGIHESVQNQFRPVSTSTVPSWLSPFSWTTCLPQGLAHAGPAPNVTNNDVLLLNLLQQQQQQQQQQLNPFSQREAVPDVTNNSLILLNMMQQQLLGVPPSPSQQHHLVYPTFNSALLSNNQPFTATTTTARHHSLTEDNNDTTAPFRF